MANFAYLISVDYIKTNTVVSNNVDDKFVKLAIKEAQIRYIKSRIGSGLYNQLVDQVYNNTVTLLNETLLDDHVIPCLKYYTLVELSPTLMYHYLNKTIGTRDGENVKVITSQELSHITNHWRLRADEESNNLRNFLRANANSYPLYLNPGSTIDTIRPKDTMVLGGFYLPPTLQEELYGYDFPRNDEII